MKIKSIVAGAAIAMTAMVSPAVADGETGLKGFAALAGVPAEALSAAEMDAVVGQGIVIEEKSTLISSASKGGSLLLFGPKLIDADSGDPFKVMPALGVRWESQTDLEAALGGTPTLVVPRAGLAMIRTKPSVAR